MSKFFEANDNHGSRIRLASIVAFWKDGNCIEFKFLGSSIECDSDLYLCYNSEQDCDADFEKLALIIDLQEG